jgi:hypothetical protein
MAISCDDVQNVIIEAEGNPAFAKDIVAKRRYGGIVRNN